jgi:hypothetical protein
MHAPAVHIVREVREAAAQLAQHVHAVAEGHLARHPRPGAVGELLPQHARQHTRPVVHLVHLWRAQAAGGQQGQTSGDGARRGWGRGGGTEAPKGVRRATMLDTLGSKGHTCGTAALPTTMTESANHSSGGGGGEGPAVMPGMRSQPQHPAALQPGTDRHLPQSSRTTRPTTVPIMSTLRMVWPNSGWLSWPGTAGGMPSTAALHTTQCAYGCARRPRTPHHARRTTHAAPRTHTHMHALTTIIQSPACGNGVAWGAQGTHELQDERGNSKCRGARPCCYRCPCCCLQRLPLGSTCLTSGTTAPRCSLVELVDGVEGVRTHVVSRALCWPPSGSIRSHGQGRPLAPAAS